MSTLLWTGKLSWPMNILTNTNNILSLFVPGSREKKYMKQRIQQGYDGVFTSHVTRYDDLGLAFQIRAAKAQLEEVDVKGKVILDVGAGTGALSFLMLEKGAAKVVCGDISIKMLEQCRKRAAEKGYGQDRIDFQQLDAESLPYDDNRFDMVVTGMTLGLLPDQPMAISEMVRVVRHSGCVSVGAHGPEHYWEAIDNYLRAMTKRYVIGYRLEWWPRKESVVIDLLKDAGLNAIQTKRVIWRNAFATGSDAFDFFVAISSAFWYARFPKDKREEDIIKVRRHFERNKVNQITDDIILVYGTKP